LPMPDKCCTTELYPQPLYFFEGDKVSLYSLGWPETHDGITGMNHHTWLQFFLTSWKGDLCQLPWSSKPVILASDN
jgi:hypothetical protein